MGLLKLVSIAWRNLWRQKRRTGITLSSIVLACFLAVFMIGINDQSWEDVIDTAARIGGGHITLQHPEYQDKPALNRTVTGGASKIAKIKELPHVTTVLPRITGQVMLSDPSTGSPIDQSFFAGPVDAEPMGDHLLITEAGTGSVARVSVSDLDDRETIASGFYFPSGLAVHGGDAYVSDTIQGAVFQIMRDGAVLAEPVMVADGLAGPEGIVIQ